VGEAPLRDFSLPLNYSRGKQPVWLLHANGEDVKVVQVLLRHGSARITMDVYAQAMTSAKPGPGTSGGDVAGRGKDEGIKLVCPHCVPGEKRGFRQVFYFVGVPDGI